MFQPYKGKRAFEDIADQIKTAILSGKLCSGDKLPSERDLAKEFQVGRVSIREALRMLETMGFVKIRKGSAGGAFVGSGDFEGMAPLILDRLLLRGTTHDMMIEARIALETAAIGLAVEHADARDLDKILENVEDSKEVLGAEYARDVVGRMIKFHVLVAEASHNIPYIIFIESMMEWAVRRLEKWIPSPEEQEFSYMSHKKMVESIKNQDKSLAVDLMRKHIQEVGTLLVSRGSVSLT
jgi:GntR family transcriptional regulator, transcriptional repressor for pyruvate dehydrogenase complex